MVSFSEWSNNKKKQQESETGTARTSAQSFSDWAISRYGKPKTTQELAAAREENRKNRTLSLMTSTSRIGQTNKGTEDISEPVAKPTGVENEEDSRWWDKYKGTPISDYSWNQFGKDMAYNAERVAAGLLGGAEDVTDFIGSGFYNIVEGVSSLGGLAPNAVSEWAGRAADSYLENSISEDYEESIRRRYNPNETAEATSGLAQNVAQIMADVATGKAAGKLAARGVGLIDDTAKAVRDANFSKAVFGTRAAGGGTNEAYDEGASSEQALIYGAGSGAVEVLTESIAGGIPGLGEGKLSQVVRKVVSSPAVNNVLNALGEGGEEAIATFVSPFIKRAVYDKDAELATADELAESVVQGILLSGMMQAGVNIPATISATAEARAVDRQHSEELGGELVGMGDDVVQAIIEEGLAYGKGTKSYKMATELQEKLAKGETVTNMDVGRLYRQNVQDMPTRQETAEVPKAGETVEAGSYTTQRLNEEQRTAGEAVRVGAPYNVLAQNTRRTAMEDPSYGKTGTQAYTELVNRSSRSAGEIRREFQSAYEAGLTELPRGMANLASEVQEIAYNAGRQDAILNMEKATEKKVTIYGKENGLVENEVSQRALSKSETEILRKMGADLGTKIVMQEQIYGGRANGNYRNGVIGIAEDAENPYLVVGKHEITHRMQELAPKEYRAYRNYAVQVLSQREGNTTLVEDYQNRAVGSGVTLSAEGAMDEIAADFTEKILTDEQALHDFVTHTNETKEGRTMAQKLFQAVREFIDKVKRVFNGNKAKMDQAAKEQFGATVEQLEKAERLWKEAYQAAESRVKAEGETKNATREGDVQYNLKGESFQEDKYFARQMDRWSELTDGTRVKVGVVQEGSALNRVGLPASGMYFDVGKIRTAMEKHKDHLTPAVLKGIPDLLNDPVVIAEYTGPNGNIKNTVNVYGNLFVGDIPVVVGIVMRKDRSGKNIITNIRTIHARSGVTKYITDKTVLYLNEDKKKTLKWFQVCGNSNVPLEGTRFGVIRSIAYEEEIVNNEVQHSLKHDKEFRVKDNKGKEISLDQLEKRHEEDYTGSNNKSSGYSLKEAVQHGEKREENRKAFLERGTRKGFTIFEGKTAAYGYRNVQGTAAKQNARQVQEELTALGVNCAIHEGVIEWNRKGITAQRVNKEAVTVEGKMVLINNGIKVPARNAAGHEAFHFWRGTDARQAFVEVLEDDLVYTSEAFQHYQAAIADAYFGAQVDLSEPVAVSRLREELFAYMSGDIHEGTNDNELRPMFRDYDAVKAAWHELVMGKKSEKINGGQFSLKGRKSPTYEELVAKDPVMIVDVTKGLTSKSYAEMKEDVRKKSADEGWLSVPHYNADTNSYMFLTDKSFTHAFSNLTAGFGEDTIRAMGHIPEIIRESILTQVADPENPTKREVKVYTFLGAIKGIKGIEPVKLTVKEFDFERMEAVPKNIREYFLQNGILETYEQLYDAHALEVIGMEGIKKGPDASGKGYERFRSQARATSDPTITVAQLLGLVNEDAQKYIPKPANKVEEQYSLKGKVPTYEQLVAKRPVKIVDIRDNGRNFKERKNRLIHKQFKPVINRDTKERIFIDKKTLTHTFSNPEIERVAAGENIEEIIENAVLTYIEPSDKDGDNSTGVYTFFGAVRTNEGIKPVKLKAKEYIIAGQDLPGVVRDYVEVYGNVDVYAKAYDARVLVLEGTEKEDASSSAVTILDILPSVNDPSASSAIKIADLLSIVNTEYRKYIPKPASESSAQNSLKGQKDILTESGKLKGVEDTLEQEFKKARFTTEAKKNLNYFTRKLLKDYGSNADTGEVRQAMDELYTYLTGKGELNWSTAYAKAYDVAEMALKDASVMNDELYQAYAGLREYLRTTGIRPDRSYDDGLLGYEDMNDFRKQNFGRIKFRNDGIPIDVAYGELAEKWPEFFDEEQHSNPGDQLVHMAEVLDSLQPYEENPYSYNMRESATWMAVDIMDRLLGQFREKQDSQFQKAEREIAKARDRVKAARTKEKEAKWEAVRKVREHYKEKEAKQSESRKARELRAKIERRVKAMDSLLRRGTDTRNVPDSLKGAVANLLESINLESGYEIEATVDKDGNPKNKRVERGTKGAEQTNRTKVFLELKEQYRAIAANNEYGMVIPDELLGDSNAGLKSLLDEVIGMADKPLALMNGEELQTVYHVLRMMEHTIRTAGRMLSASRWSSIHEAADGFLEHSASRKTKRALTTKHSMLDIETPYTYFSHFGDAGHDFYRMLRNAQDIGEVRLRELKEREKQVASQEKRRKAEKETFTMTTEGGKKLVLSKAHAMEIYLLNKREQAQGHLLRGGIMQPEVGRVRAGEEAILLNELDVANIIGKLTEEERKIADGMQKLTLLLAEWGNEASLKVYGIRKFNDPNYWTIRSSSVGINESLEGQRGKPRSIKNMGSAKDTQKGASNTLEIHGVFDTFDKHASDMLCYSAWLAPMEDASRLFNYKFRDENGKTIKGILKHCAGEQAEAYWSELMEDIQNGLSMPADTAMESDVMKAIGNVKKASVASNIRVIAQQPTAYARAAVVLGPDVMLAALGKNVAVKPMLDGWKKAVKYAPIAARKADGGYEIASNQKQLAELMYQPETFLGKAAKAAKAAPLFLPGLMDQLTWGTIWNACELQIQKQNKSLVKDSDEFNETVKELFTEVIDQTQVVDGVLQRSRAMRSGSNFMKQMTSYTGESTQGANMVIRAYDQLRYETNPAKRGKAIKHLGRAVYAYTISTVLNAFAQSLVDAFRDDDDEKDYWERVWTAFSGINGNEASWRDYARNVLLASNMVNNMNPATWIPVAKDVMSLIQGYSVERMDAASMGEFFDTVAMAVKSISGEGKYTIGYAVTKSLVAGAKLLGSSSTNLLRDVESIVRTVQVETDSYLARYETMKLMTRIQGDLGSYMDLLYEAYLNDREAYQEIYEDLRAKGIKADKLESEMDSRIEKAALISTGYKSTKEAYDALYALKKASQLSRYNTLKSTLLNVAYTTMDGKREHLFTTGSIDNAMLTRRVNEGVDEMGYSSTDGVYDDMYDELKDSDMNGYWDMVFDMMALGVDATDVENAMRSRAKEDGLTVEDLTEALATGGFRPKYDVEEEDKIDIDDLSDTEYKEYATEYADIVDELLDDFQRNGFASLEAKEANEWLTSAYNYAKDTALESATDGEFESETQWINKAQESDKLGLEVGEYIRLMAMYSSSAIGADGVYAAYDNGVDVATYLKAKDGLGDIYADKDANGKSITGTRRPKVEAFLNELGLSYEDYMYLLGSEYDSVKKSQAYKSLFGG